MLARAVALALLGVRAVAQTNAANGLAGCQCIGLSASIPRVNCTDANGDTPPWAGNYDSCVVATSVATGAEYPGTTSAGNPLYPSNYGESCMRHIEPGWSSCYNLTTQAELPTPTAEFCEESNNDWCYVELCNCDQDLKASTYFPGDTIYYSYLTCGNTDRYTTAEMNNNPTDAVFEAAGCPVTTTGATRASVVSPALVASLAGILACAAL